MGKSHPGPNRPLENVPARVDWGNPPVQKELPLFTKTFQAICVAGLLVLAAPSAAQAQPPDGDARPFHLWLRFSAAPFATIRPGLSDSARSGEESPVLWGAAMDADYKNRMLSLMYLGSFNILDCFIFVCKEPLAQTRQAQLLLGWKWPGGPGFASLQAGPALVYGVGRGAFIETACPSQQDCKLAYEEKSFLTGGLAMQASALLAGPAAGIGITLNGDWNPEDIIFGFMLSVAFGRIMPESD
jgi:hypothetical protein